MSVMCMQCVNRGPQEKMITFKEGDTIRFFGTEYPVVRGNEDGRDTVDVEQRNGIRICLWVFPRKGISKV